jgi:hypothetical protein
MDVLSLHRIPTWWSNVSTKYICRKKKKTGLLSPILETSGQQGTADIFKM